MKGDHLFTDHNVTYPNKPPESDTSLNSECLQRAYMTPNRHLTPNFPQIKHQKRNERSRDYFVTGFPVRLKLHMTD